MKNAGAFGAKHTMTSAKAMAAADSWVTPQAKAGIGYLFNLADQDPDNTTRLYQVMPQPEWPKAW